MTSQPGRELRYPLWRNFPSKYIGEIRRDIGIGVPQFYNRYLDNTPGHDSEFIGELVGSTPPAGENFKDIKITPPNILKKETIQRIECHSSNNKQFTNITPGYD